MQGWRGERRECHGRRVFVCAGAVVARCGLAAEVQTSGGFGGRVRPATEASNPVFDASISVAGADVSAASA
eukprot:3030853-Prymnesium_polylepis.1